MGISEIWSNFKASCKSEEYHIMLSIKLRMLFEYKELIPEDSSDIGKGAVNKSYCFKCDGNIIAF